MSADTTEGVASLAAYFQSPEGADALAHALIAALKEQGRADPDARLRALVPLLKEYTRKIEQFTSGNVTNDDPGVQRILASAKRLAQFVSQRLHRVEDEVLRMELEIRLAEYEAVLLATGAKEAAKSP
ncbi:MAG: hypothetical protein K2V38_25495 [Gemmataceae bacterium]|nr:hypothetical protein [Gemmataceae bacterium]